MTRSLCLVRPEPGWSASAAAARALGLTVIGQPLFVAESIAWEQPEGNFSAMLAGSAAVFRHGGAGLARFAGLPVMAVGEATAAAAREAGFTVERTGTGGLQALLETDAGLPRKYLRLGGEERVSLILGAGQEIIERAVYRMRTVPLTAELAGTLAQGRSLVALHSAAAARQFAAEADRLNLEKGRLFLIVLGPRIAKAAGPGWAAVHVADSPSDSALLAKAAAMCK